MAYYDAVRRTLIIIFILNIIVALFKGAYGLFTNSLSMTTDGLHSLFDSSSNIIGLVGISLASRPPDREHPYGHSKFETFATLGIAVLLFASCFQVIMAAVGRFLTPSVPDITEWSFAIMVGTLVLNIGVSAYEYIIGRRLKSSILVADSMHTRSDVFASIGVILGLVAVKMGYPLADPIIALLICGLIILTGLEIIKDSSRVLLDRALIEESVIRKLAESVSGVCSCHRIRTRGMPGEMYVDLHIGVDSNLPMEEAHKVGEDVEERIKNSIEGVREVMVHLEPKDYCELKEMGGRHK
ncbi:Ferrous-iron efflux pump FieF [uncultured archaeon]|nr:Ferrous-iron efflux pump FieF [uncultured archaeon]